MARVSYAALHRLFLPAAWAHLTGCLLAIFFIFNSSSSIGELKAALDFHTGSGGRLHLS